MKLVVSIFALVTAVVIWLVWPNDAKQQLTLNPVDIEFAAASMPPKPTESSETAIAKQNQDAKALTVAQVADINQVTNAAPESAQSASTPLASSRLANTEANRKAQATSVNRLLDSPLQDAVLAGAHRYFANINRHIVFSDYSDIVRTGTSEQLEQQVRMLIAEQYQQYSPYDINLICGTRVCRAEWRLINAEALEHDASPICDQLNQTEIKNCRERNGVERAEKYNDPGQYMQAMIETYDNEEESFVDRARAGSLGDKEVSLWIEYHQPQADDGQILELPLVELVEGEQLEIELTELLTAELVLFSQGFDTPKTLQSISCKKRACNVDITFAAAYFQFTSDEDSSHMTSNLEISFSNYLCAIRKNNIDLAVIASSVGAESINEVVFEQDHYWVNTSYRCVLPVDEQYRS